MTWLAVTPQAVVKAHIEMMPRLQAEESSQLVSVLAMGRGLKLGDWIKKQLGRWERTIRGGSPRRAPGAAPSDLVKIGIGFRKVEKVG